jgi:hypothetical protein
MSNDAQILVAIDCPAGQAQVRGDAVLGWLVDRGIVEHETSDCVLGNDGQGHSPGPHLETAVDGDTATTRQLWTNGLSIVVGRTIFDSGSNGVELQCPECSATFEPDDDWSDAAQTWAEGEDSVPYSCPACGRDQALQDWTGPWPWGFGPLGFEFWNWPPLNRDFVESLSALLPGRVRLVRQHL